MPSSSLCRIDPVLNSIGDHWTLSIIHELSTGPRRTLELLAAFKGLSTKTLADRLKKMERNRIVARKSFPESPPRVEYSLTQKGRELLPVLRAIAEVASKWNTEVEVANDELNCRACEAVFNEGLSENVPGRMGAEPQHRDLADQGSPSHTQRVARKRTDVTLL